jgi:acetylornithine deacetylase/succinyl-diaminopimelate desuccinylase-like protein
MVEQLRCFADTLQSPARVAFSVDPPFYPPFEWQAPEHPFLQGFADAGRRVLGPEVSLGYTAGLSDANLISEAGIPCIVYEALAGDYHQCNEWVDIPSLVAYADVILATALRFLQEPPV